MGTRALLDCTLRDGGYVNDWRFGQDNILEVFERLVQSGVEYIEVGFLDARQPFDPNRSIQPDTAAYDRIFEGVSKGGAIVLGMIDYGTCPIENLGPASESFLDGIRVIFKEHLRDKALAFCAEVKKLGYLVFAQMVSVTTYTDEALADYARECNKLQPYATSMVDTYGLLDEEHLMHIFSILDSNLDPTIKVGFHAHNNFQLGFADAKCFLGSKAERDLLADGTLYGMGKSAGNAPLELLLMYGNKSLGKHYDIVQALEAIEHVLLDIYKKQYWGYNSFFFLASETACHPNYVSYLQAKRTLSIGQIQSILEELPPGKKLLFDKSFAEKLYIDYQSEECDDSGAVRELTKLFAGKPLLLLGPGRNMEREKERVEAYLKKEQPVVLSINYVPQDIPVDYIFLTKAKRYRDLRREWKEGPSRAAKIIATSNVSKVEANFSYVLNYSSYIDRDTEIIDNSFVMLLKALAVCGVQEVAAAGFDGYSKRTDNYFDTSREYGFVREKADYLNEYVRNFLQSSKVKVRFVTKSKYKA